MMRNNGLSLLVFLIHTSYVVLSENISPQPTLSTLQQLSASGHGIPVLQFQNDTDLTTFSNDVLNNLLYHKIVIVNMDNLYSSDSNSTLMQQIVNHIGIPMDQSIHFQGQYVWDVTYNQSLFKNGALGNGLDFFDFHTENSFDCEPVRYFGMHYLHNNEYYGGENQFISIDDILSLLNRDEIHQLFSSNVAFKAPALFKKTSNHTHSNGTILFANECIETCVRFRRSVVLKNYTNTNILDLVDKFYGLVHDIAANSPLMIIPENNIVFWDNWHFLHSRKRILNEKRLLRRMLFNPL